MNDELNEITVEAAELCAGYYAEAHALIHERQQMEQTAHALAVSLLEQATEREKLEAEQQTALAEYIELARRLPGVVPEMISGRSLPEVLESLQASQAAYRNTNASNETMPVRIIGGRRAGRRSATALQDSLIRQGFEQLRLRGF
jgi:Zn-dependent peptidase ImmA (M78 family)